MPQSNDAMRPIRAIMHARNRLKGFLAGTVVFGALTMFRAIRLYRRHEVGLPLELGRKVFLFAMVSGFCFCLAMFIDACLRFRNRD